MKILFLAHLFPLPLDSGGKIKSYHTLKALARRHEVYLLSYTRAEDDEQCINALEHLCHAAITIPLTRSKIKQIISLTSSIFLDESFIVSRDYSIGMHTMFSELANAIRPDVVHIDHLQMAQFVQFGNSYKTILDHHNVESSIIRRIAETSSGFAMRIGAKVEWPKLQRYELNVCRNCDMVLTVSDEDKSTLQRLDPAISNIKSVPIGVDVEYFKPISRNPESKNILSIGTMYWPPNIDSMLYFYSEIYPLIKNKIPGCTLTIAGQRPTPSIQALASDTSVTVTGYVDDIRETAKDCGVFIVPLRSGSGVRVKILNAMAMGLPIVSTSIGAEGLEVTNGEHLLIADNSDDFANAVVAILKNPELTASLGNNARKLVCDKYSWETVGEQLLGVYDGLVL